MEEKVKVLVLASWYPSRVKPHLGTFVQRQTEAVADKVRTSALFVCSDSRMKKGFDIEPKAINGVFTVNVYYSKSHNVLLKAWRFCKAYYLGWQCVLTHFGKPDMVHLNILWPAGLVAYFLKLFYGLKYIITENWTGYLASDGPYQRSSFFRIFLTRIIARHAEVIVPVSLDLKKAMSVHGLGSKFEIVYNAVNTDLFSLPSITSSSGKIIFLHVSTTLDKQKNVSGILNAVKMLAQRKNNFELRIVSESDYSSHELKAMELGILNEYVFFESAKQTQGIAEEMRKADCFVLFSNYENLPVVIVEAMASGLPVISSAVGGVPEHISNEFGLLVEPRDINGLCNAMEHMMENRSYYNSIKIREYAVKNFSYKAISEKTYAIYRKMI